MQGNDYTIMKRSAKRNIYSSTLLFSVKSLYTLVYDKKMALMMFVVYMSNFENKIIIIINKKRQSKSSNTINLYIYLSVLKLLSKIDVYMYILYKPA